jgi:hypothetical protein
MHRPEYSESNISKTEKYETLDSILFISIGRISILTLPPMSTA